jgi:O-antigen/teichoic acid export membrane protein
VRKTITNAAVLAGVRVAAPVLSLVVVLVVSRRLGAEGLGRYSLAYAFLGLFGLLAAAGLPALLTREGARRPDELGRLLGGAVALSGGVSAVLTLAMLVLASGYDPATRQALSILSLALAPMAFCACGEAAFLASERTVPIAVVCLVEQVVKAGLGVTLLWAGSGLNGVLAAAVLGKVLASGVGWVWLGRVGVRMERPESLRALAVEMPVFACSAVCATLYWRVDVFLLSWLRGVGEVGCYTAAYRVLDAAILLPQSLCQAWYPRLATGAAPDGYGRWLLASTAPPAVAIAIGAGQLVTLLYGAGLEGAGPVLAVLIWTAVPYAWNRYQAYRLVAADRQTTDLAINLMLLAVNVALNLALIPRHGAMGAAVVTLATAVGYGAVQRSCLRRGAAPA